MKNFFWALCLSSTTFVACHKDTTPYEITFDVKNASGTVAFEGQIGKEMTFDVTFTHKAKGTVHNVKISILDAAAKEIKVLEEKQEKKQNTHTDK